MEFYATAYVSQVFLGSLCIFVVPILFGIHDYNVHTLSCTFAVGVPHIWNIDFSL